MKKLLIGALLGTLSTCAPSAPVHADPDFRIWRDAGKIRPVFPPEPDAREVDMFCTTLADAIGFDRDMVEMDMPQLKRRLTIWRRGKGCWFFSNIFGEPAYGTFELLRLSETREQGIYRVTFNDTLAVYTVAPLQGDAL